MQPKPSQNALNAVRSIFFRPNGLPRLEHFGTYPLTTAKEAEVFTNAIATLIDRQFEMGTPYPSSLAARAATDVILELPELQNSGLNLGQLCVKVASIIEAHYLPLRPEPVYGIWINEPDEGGPGYWVNSPVGIPYYGPACVMASVAHCLGAEALQVLPFGPDGHPVFPETETDTPKRSIRGTSIEDGLANMEKARQEAPMTRDEEAREAMDRR